MARMPIAPDRPSQIKSFIKLIPRYPKLKDTAHVNNIQMSSFNIENEELTLLVLILRMKLVSYNLTIKLFP